MPVSEIQSPREYLIGVGISLCRPWNQKVARLVQAVVLVEALNLVKSAYGQVTLSQSFLFECVVEQYGVPERYQVLFLLISLGPLDELVKLRLVRKCSHMHNHLV
jgi:hypothetical protein